MVTPLLLYTRFQGPRNQLVSSLSQVRLNRRSCRRFIQASNPHRKNIIADPKPPLQQSPSTDSPESLQPRPVPDVANTKPNGEPKAPDLLGEQTVSNKEQRKADWAIMKEMSRYLWPKVWEAET